MNPTLHRPTPIPESKARPVDRATPARHAVRLLLDGETLRVEDHYGTGAEILDQLRAATRPAEAAGFESRQAAEKRYREAASRLLAPIVEHRVALEGGREVGFLAELYPELSRFYLSFDDLQKLHGSWGRYREGIHLAVLGHAVHPFYGTYTPTRVIHLELFATWLSQYEGSRESAIDVGTGCGVLALMLCRAGFSHVRATDINPNAIESVRRDLARLPSPPPITLEQADLLGEDPTPAALIVFNPPWTRGDGDSPLERSLTFQDGFFERFFDQAIDHLAPDGRIVLVFSNLIELVQPQVAHPIEAELARGRLTLVQKLRRKVPPTPTSTGRRRRTKERVEIWELARP